jgi:hypothetical protein
MVLDRSVLCGTDVCDFGSPLAMCRKEEELETTKTVSSGAVDLIDFAMTNFKLRKTVSRGGDHLFETSSVRPNLLMICGALLPT